METIRFNDPALLQHAIRDMHLVVPGRRYVDIHIQDPNYYMEHDYYSGEKYPSSAPDFASVIWVTGLGEHDEDREDSTFSLNGQQVFWYVSDKNGGYIHRRFAADAGIWNAPNINYKNTCNFLLDVDFLAGLGIEVDTTRPVD